MTTDDTLQSKYIEDNKDKDLVETEIAIKVDENDDFVHEQIFKIINHTSAQTVVNFYSPGSWDFIHGAVFNSGLSVIKANAHKRNYDTLLPGQRVWAKDRIARMDSKIDSQIFSWELAIELEGTLSQLKSALDSISRAIGRFYGIHIEGFSKRKDVDGISYSGQILINSLKNLPKEKREQAEALIRHIENHKVTLSKFIQTRDLFIHPSKPFMESMSGFYYYRETTEFRDPIVGHGTNPEHSYYQEQYIREAIEITAAFISDLLIHMLSDAVPGFDLDIDKNAKYQYSWPSS